MKIKFCPNCDQILLPTKKGEKFFVECNKCGHGKEVKDLKLKEKIKKIEKGKGVVKGGNPLATYHNKCPKCGYDKAQIIDMGIFYSDEDNLILLKCGQCGYSERIGRKVS